MASSSSKQLPYNVKYTLHQSLGGSITLYRTLSAMGSTRIDISEEAMRKFLEILYSRKGNAYFKSKSILDMDRCSGYLGIVSAVLGAKVAVVSKQSHLPDILNSIGQNQDFIDKQGGKISCYMEIPKIKYDLIILPLFDISKRIHFLKGLLTNYCHDRTIFLMTFDKASTSILVKDTTTFMKEHHYSVFSSKSIVSRKSEGLETNFGVEYNDIEFDEAELKFFRNIKADVFWYEKDPTAVKVDEGKTKELEAKAVSDPTAVKVDEGKTKELEAKAVSDPTSVKVDEGKTKEYEAEEALD